MITDNQVKRSIHEEGVIIFKSGEEILSLSADRAHTSASEAQGALDSPGDLGQIDCWALLQI